MNNAASMIPSSCVRQWLLIVSFLLFNGLVEASPKIEFIGMVSPDTLELVICAGQVHVGRQVPYVKQAGDVINVLEHRRTLIRQGTKAGVLVGQAGEMFCPFDTFSGDLLGVTWADRKASYWITSATDDRYQQTLHPVQVFRKSRPTGVARIDDWKFLTPIEHHLFLVLPHALKLDATYELSFEGTQLPRQEFKCQPLSLRSEAVHVSHIGFHPEDGVKVYTSTTRLMDTRNGLSSTDPSNFRNLVAGKTSTLLPGVWGGYMDAGDWDRRIQHLIASVILLDLAEQFPSYFKSLSLGIPESQNGLPDVVDEALFNLDFYRRTQTPGGGIRGGIESEEHPNFGEASWQESLTVLAYEPGSWSSFYYAGVAAKAAGVLKLLGHDALAQTYEASAIKAMAWAEADYAQRAERGDSYRVNGVKIDRMDDHSDVRDKRNYAAVELFRLTGDLRWHHVFVETTMLKKPGVDLYLWQSHEQSQAAWTYVNTRRTGVDKSLQAFCRQAILKEAEDRMRTQSAAAFRWTKNDWAPPTTTLSVSDAISLVRAHQITADEKYLRAIVLSCQAGLGANPLNLCYTTHVGHRWPQNPLHLDARHTGQLPPEGITVFGPIDPTVNDTFMGPIIKPNCFPAPEKWPVMEAYWDVFWYPIMCEFTVQKPMAQNAFLWGYLAGVHAEPPR